MKITNKMAYEIIERKRPASFRTVEQIKSRCTKDYFQKLDNFAVAVWNGKENEQRAIIKRALEKAIKIAKIHSEKLLGQI